MLSTNGQVVGIWGFMAWDYPFGPIPSAAGPTPVDGVAEHVVLFAWVWSSSPTDSSPSLLVYPSRLPRCSLLGGQHAHVRTQEGRSWISGYRTHTATYAPLSRTSQLALATVLDRSSRWEKRTGDGYKSQGVLLLMITVRKRLGAQPLFRPGLATDGKQQAAPRNYFGRDVSGETGRGIQSRR